MNPLKSFLATSHSVTSTLLLNKMLHVIVIK